MDISDQEMLYLLKLVLQVLMVIVGGADADRNDASSRRRVTPKESVLKAIGVANTIVCEAREREREVEKYKRESIELVKEIVWKSRCSALRSF